MKNEIKDKNVWLKINFASDIMKSRAIMISARMPDVIKKAQIRCVLAGKGVLRIRKQEGE